VEAEVRGFHARVVVSHRFVNREPQAVEAVYVFPLDEGAAVCGFEAVIDGTLVIGEVLQREQAFERYDDAIGEGHGAFLLDEERPDVFQASIGNLLPGREVLVRLTYVAELTVDEGRIRFIVPTTVSPRYAPATDRTGVGRTDAEALNPPRGWSVPYGLNLSVRAVMPGVISVVESPSHPISLRINGADATITLAQDDVALDRDFVLSIEAAGLDAPHAVVERREDGKEAIGVAFAPRFDNATGPADVIFVVDRSGSMDGQSIDEVRNALQLCLRSLTRPVVSTSSASDPRMNRSFQRVERTINPLSTSRVHTSRRFVRTSAARRSCSRSRPFSSVLARAVCRGNSSFSRMAR